MSVTPAGYEVDGIHEAADPVEAVRRAEAIFIGEEVELRYDGAEQRWCTKLATPS